MVYKILGVVVFIIGLLFGWAALKRIVALIMFFIHGEINGGFVLGKIFVEIIIALVLFFIARFAIRYGIRMFKSA